MLTALAAVGQTGSPELVPTPRYRILEISLQIYAQGLQRPEEAKGTIESTYQSWEWWNGMDGAYKQLLHCPAEAGKFTYSDFKPTSPPTRDSKNTGTLPIVAYRIRCAGLRGTPPWQTCNAWDCGTLWSNWYNMSASCPVGWVFQSTSGAPQCGCPDGTDLRKSATGWQCTPRCAPTPQQPWCETRDDSCPAGNPILPATAVKVHTEVDYTGAGADALEFRRSFRSSGTTPYVEPGGWSHWVHNWGRRIEVFPTPGRAGRLWMIRDDASQRIYTSDGSSSWTAWQLGDRNQLTEQRDANGQRLGFRYLVWADDSVEHYDSQGRLLKVVQRNGWTTTLTYSAATTPVSVAPRPGLLISVRNQFGRELRLTYDSGGRLKELLPPGSISGAPPGASSSPIRYAHNEAGSLGSGVVQADQPTSVTWQDGAVRRYHYEQAGQPGLLTGITDELGVRIGRYTYTSTGRATRTEGPAGTNVVDIVHNGDRTDVIDRSGSSPVTTTYQWQRVQGAMRPVSVSAPCPLCGTSQASTAYTATGEVARSVGHDGRVTFFSYDSKGRETERAVFESAFNTAATRPALSAAASVVTTQWHARWRLPLQRAEPGAITTWTYDGKGNVTTQRTQTTTDGNGSTGLAVVRAGPINGVNRTWSSYGLLASAADVAEGVIARSWTYSYATSGDLARVTGTEGITTAWADTTITPQGLLTRLRTSSGAEASFNYGARGNLIVAQLPDHSITLSANARGFVTRLDFSTGQRLSIEYDASGLPLRLLDSNGIATQIVAVGMVPARTSGSRALGAAASMQPSDWLARLPLGSAKAQLIGRLPPLISQGIGALPPQQSRPLEPGEPSLATQGCCGLDTRLTAEQLQRLMQQAASAAGLAGGSAADAFDFWIDWLLTWKSRSDLRKKLLCDPRNWALAQSGCFEAHHIVAWRDPRAKPSRDKLADFGIDLNDVANGVILQCDKHRGMHSNMYYDKVNARLDSEVSKGGVLGALERIANEIKSGSFP